MRLAVLCSCVLAFGSSLSLAQPCDFSTGPCACWTFGGGTELIVRDGGNPGAYLRTSGLTSPMPRLRAAASASCGDQFGLRGNLLYARLMSAVVHLRVFSVDVPAFDRPLSLLLRSDNRTPTDPSDDYAAARIPALTPESTVPRPDEGWKWLILYVPSVSTGLPAGWTWLPLGPNSPVQPSWHRLITNVAGLEFVLGDPRRTEAIRTWTLGVDNVGGVRSQNDGGPADVDDGSFTGQPDGGITIDDLLYYLYLFSIGDVAADLDDGSFTGTLDDGVTIEDLLFYLSRYEAG